MSVIRKKVLNCVTSQVIMLILIVPFLCLSPEFALYQSIYLHIFISTYLWLSFIRSVHLYTYLIYLPICLSIHLPMALYPSLFPSCSVCHFFSPSFLSSNFRALFLILSVFFVDFSIGLAIRASEMTAWAGCSKCCPAPANCMYCPLCLASVEDANEAWKEHLIHRCPENKRGSNHK